jgi:hypothetical protein
MLEFEEGRTPRRVTKSTCCNWMDGASRLWDN